MATTARASIWQTVLLTGIAQLAVAVIVIVVGYLSTQTSWLVFGGAVAVVGAVTAMVGVVLSWTRRF